MSYQSKIPLTVYLLGLTIFSLITGEFMVAGIMPALAEAFSVSFAKVGNLIAFHALGMALGGPPLAVLLISSGIGNKHALVGLLALFVVASSIAAVAQTYEVLLFARVVMGVATSACIGLCMTICAGLVNLASRGRAVSIVLAGLMLSPVAGVPLTNVIEHMYGWRASSWLVAVLSLICTFLIASQVPGEQTNNQPALRLQIHSLKNASLWGAYFTSGCIIGATFAAFSYITPILIEEVGVRPGSVAPLLALYGVGNVIGNTVIGRIADRYTFQALGWGLVLLIVALGGFALAGDLRWLNLGCFLAFGFTGVALNPAMVARVMKAAEPHALVNTLHTSVITGGLALGSWVGGEAIDVGFGLRAPLWVGVGMAALGLASLALPILKLRSEKLRRNVESMGHSVAE
ncbi:MFS transporter [Pseudomonas palleroniana]|uniref:MFS transporter n=1 Tax=Pseudomonas palleroniana TaxID=191390 RepID=UPI001FD4370B|nr:MFS transporter [Pseudomonas palleroniana]UOP10333.1 MFS transporter [Pseudomonas palleroniana]